MKLLNKMRFPRLKYLLQNRALILMYHRIFDPLSDPWKLSVSPGNFEDQIITLKEHFNIVSTEEIVEQITQGKIKNRTVALTFDDGYCDNYETAMPLLGKHNIPATFFITDSYLGGEHPFWWDELEHIIVHTPSLPSIFSMKCLNQDIHFDLSKESILNKEIKSLQKGYRAHSPPTLRTKLYVKLWKIFSPLPKYEQLQLLHFIRNWAGLSKVKSKVHGAMTVTQLRLLSETNLFTIGGHTKNHPLLGRCTYEDQKREILNNKEALENILGKDINLFAFPSGSYNDITLKILKQHGFSAAFASSGKPVSRNTDRLQISRLQINNWDSKRFKHFLEKKFES